MEALLLIPIALGILILGICTYRAASKPIVEDDDTPRPSYMVKFGFTANYDKFPDKNTKWWCSVLFTWKKDDAWSKARPVVVIEGRSPHCPNTYSREQVNEYTRRVLMQLQPEVLALATLWESGHHNLPSNIDGKVVERVGA